MKQPSAIHISANVLAMCANPKNKKLLDVLASRLNEEKSDQQDNMRQSIWYFLNASVNFHNFVTNPKNHDCLEGLASYLHEATPAKQEEIRQKNWRFNQALEILHTLNNIRIQDNRLYLDFLKCFIELHRFFSLKRAKDEQWQKWIKEGQVLTWSFEPITQQKFDPKLMFDDEQKPWVQAQVEALKKEHYELEINLKRWAQAYGNVIDIHILEKIMEQLNRELETTIHELVSDFFNANSTIYVNNLLKKNPEQLLSNLKKNHADELQLIRKHDQQLAAQSKSKDFWFYLNSFTRLTNFVIELTPPYLCADALVKVGTLFFPKMPKTTLSLMGMFIGCTAIYAFDVSQILTQLLYVLSAMVAYRFFFHEQLIDESASIRKRLIFSDKDYMQAFYILCAMIIPVSLILWSDYTTTQDLYAQFQNRVQDCNVDLNNGFSPLDLRVDSVNDTLTESLNRGLANCRNRLISDITLTTSSWLTNPLALFSNRAVGRLEWPGPNNQVVQADCQFEERFSTFLGNSVNILECTNVFASPN